MYVRLLRYYNGRLTWPLTDYEHPNPNFTLPCSNRATTDLSSTWCVVSQSTVLESSIVLFAQVPLPSLRQR